MKNKSITVLALVVLTLFAALSLIAGPGSPVSAAPGDLGVEHVRSSIEEPIPPDPLQSRGDAVPGKVRTLDTPIELLIITPEEFSDPLQPLVTHKTATGVTAALENLEDIYATYSGADEPEQIKRAIEFYEQNHSIKYVMLVGDVDKLPVRWVAYRQRDDPGAIEYFLPSDLYYGDLYDSSGAFDDWDYNDNGIYGEHRKSGLCADEPYSVNLDRVDLHPDVAVGRVPASDIEEVENYVAKVIRYEYLTYGADWLDNVLLLAGGGHTCHPGVHFDKIQSNFRRSVGDAASFRTHIHSSYIFPADDRPTVPCYCLEGESEDECLARTRLNSLSEANVFVHATSVFTVLPRDIPSSEYEEVGLLGWYDHYNNVRDYFLDVNNADKLSVAFSSGCSAGGFAGGPPGEMARFAPDTWGGRTVGGQELEYRTTNGHLLNVRFMPEWVDCDGDGVRDKKYHIVGCSVDDWFYPVVVDTVDGSVVDGHCGGGLYPDMSLMDDFAFGSDCTSRGSRPYILNPPAPDPIQPGIADWDAQNPETKLFAKHAATGDDTADDTGWIGMVGATKSASFPGNGELMVQFFRGLVASHSTVAGRSRLGDAWRSMLEFWLEIIFEDGSFDMGPIFEDYNISREEEFTDYCASFGMQHTMMYGLFGDPSLRVGGVEDLTDTEPPITFDDADTSWHGDDTAVHLTVVDNGSPPSPASGPRLTRYGVDEGNWQTGKLVVIEAPDDHSNDGVHPIDYRSEDFAGNEELTKTTHVRIETVPPDTEILLNGEPPGMVFCPLGSECPPAMCYISPVSVTLTAWDGTSGPASTWYRLEGDASLYHEYVGPFDVSGFEPVTQRTIYYGSVDNAGNSEPTEEETFCVSNWQGGLFRDEIRILAALEEIIRMQMRQAFAATLPVMDSVVFEYASPVEGEWRLIGVDQDGTDGWSMDWATTQVSNGDYMIRMTAWGSPLGQTIDAPQSVVVYQEVVSATVSNIPSLAYEFDLQAAPAAVDRGQTVEYTLTFVNQMGGTLNDLNVTCDTDVGMFTKIVVQDGGTLDPNGMPTWSRGTLGDGQKWTTHFNAVTRADLVPGTGIGSQAFLTADMVPLLLSDDPTTKIVKDLTAVTVNLIDGAVTGSVTDAHYATPISATVTVTGPFSRTVTTDATGIYSATGLPPGVYMVSVAAEGYDYQGPSGPVSVTLDGTVESVRADFYLAHADMIPPVSSMFLTAEEIVAAQSSLISGTAYDYPPGSGVREVELSIYRPTDGKSWDGDSWEDAETWLPASGTTAWMVDCGGIAWDSGGIYAIQSRATDNAGNVERPQGSITEAGLGAPRLIAPADGAQVYEPFTLEWSLVLDARYHVQIDDDDDFQSPEAYVAYIDSNTHTPFGLAGGTYHWRVKAIDREFGHPESAWSTVRTVTVVTRLYLPVMLRGGSE